MDTQKFSIFVKPKGALQAHLREVIRSLAQKYGGPVFEPHVTVLADIPHLTIEEAKSKTLTLAEKLQPYTMHFQDVSRGAEYFRCVFLKIQATEGVLSAFEEARKIFGYTDREEHMPHLSLFYGTIPEDQKRMMQNDVQQSVDPQQSFLADTLSLYDMSGTPEEWRKVASFHL
jgi:2'-5' RNA ligase